MKHKPSIRPSAAPTQGQPKPMHSTVAQHAEAATPQAVAADEDLLAAAPQRAEAESASADHQSGGAEELAQDSGYARVQDWAYVRPFELAQQGWALAAPLASAGGLVGHGLSGGGGSFVLPQVGVASVGASSLLGAPVQTASQAVSGTTPTVAPSALRVDGIIDNNGTMRVLYSEAAELADSTPVLTGHAGANQRLSVRDKASGDILGLVTTDAIGAWSLELPTLQAGQHELLVQSVAADREEVAFHFQVADTTVSSVATTASKPTYLVSGWEDTAYVFGRSDLIGLRDSSKINIISDLLLHGLPSEGALQFLDANNQWTAARVGQLISVEEVLEGRLRFVPDANEAGSAFFNAPGVGDHKNVYAEVDLQVVGVSAASIAGDLTLQLAIQPLSASLGAATMVSRSVTSYQTVATYTTMYRTILDDTRVSHDSFGHDWRIRYKLSNGHEGDIDINDSKGWTDGSDRVVYQGSQHVGVTDLMLYQAGKNSLWLSQKNGGFHYTNVSNIGLEDCHGIFGWGWFADWNDGYVSVRVESFQQQSGTTQRATTTTVQDTQYKVLLSNAAQYATDHPNACFNVVLTGGSNYQLRDAADRVLMTGPGTFQATVSQINAGLKVHVFNGGSAPSVDTGLVGTTSPLVIDLNGDGVHTIGVDDGVLFDIDASGHAKQVGWTDAHDGLLVLDLNGNGRIDDGRELFGNHTALNAGGTAADGWQALAQYDVTLDGVISKADAIFDHLQIWADSNTNGVTDAGELHSLLSLGIAAIGLQHDGSQTVQNGNLLSGLAEARTHGGQTLQVTDAWLQTRAWDEQPAAYVVI